MMRNFVLGAGAMALAFVSSAPAIAQIDPSVSGLPVASAPTSSDLIDIRQGGQKKITTVSQITNSVQQRLRRAMSRAAAFNPEDAPVHATATFTIDQTNDTSLTNVKAAPELLNVTATSGGKPTLVASDTKLVFPVVSLTPMTTGGNMSTYLSAGMNAWTWADEFWTDSLNIQVSIDSFTIYGTRVLVDGQYVGSKVPVMPSANGTSYVHITPGGPRKLRRIRIEGSARTTLNSVAVSATSTISKPVYADPFTMLSVGDSWAEGTGLSDNWTLAFPQVLGKRLGATDVRQLAVGSTGYVSNNNGNRSRLIDQLPWWFTVNSDLNPSKIDLIVISHGYNDYSFQSQVNGRALEAYRAIRALCPNAMIMVLGAQTGTRNNDSGTIAVENAIRDAVAAFNDPLTFFIPVSTDASPWITGTGKVGATTGNGNADFVMSSDGVHPGSYGHDLVAARADLGIKSIVLGR